MLKWVTDRLTKSKTQRILERLRDEKELKEAVGMGLVVSTEEFRQIIEFQLKIEARLIRLERGFVEVKHSSRNISNKDEVANEIKNVKMSKSRNEILTEMRENGARGL